MKLYELFKKSNKTIFVEYPADTILYFEGDTCNQVCLVLNGEIAIETTSIDGKEEIISRIGEGEFFGNALVFSNEPKFLGDVMTKEKTRICYMKKEDLVSFLIENNLVEEYISLLVEKTISLNKKAKLLAHKSIRERIIFFLEMNHNSMECSVTRLAEEIVIPRPSVSRELSNMIDEGIIYKKNKKIILKNNNN